MAFLFETSWQVKWDFFERVYDTNLNKSIVRPVTCPAEYYLETTQANPFANYTSVIDETKIFEKHQGIRKGASKEYGYTGPLYRNIRDNYWNADVEKSTYNKDCLYWCLDIETRSGVNSTGFPVAHKSLEEITMFQIFDSKLNSIVVFGTR